jgi:RNA polymerase sigma factor (sigma-70 family)
MLTKSSPIIAGNAADAALFTAAIAGDRGAFAQIVQRYQNLICSLAYSSLGDLGRSEDLAQETFIAAWQSLASLREPEKLKSWLCAIARHKLSNQRRQLSTDVAANATALESGEMLPSNCQEPAERSIRLEEQQLIWDVLSQMPEVYREPLVLYYRSQQSVSEVAAQLDMTEDAVRQRLARGRKQLREDVAELVEKTLRGSRPGTLFAAAVLAALPAAAPQAAAMGVAATANAAGTKTIAAVGITAISGAVLGPLLGFLGAAFGVAAGISSTRSPRERRFAIVLTLYIALLVGSLLAALVVMLQWFPSYYRTAWVQTAIWLPYALSLALIIRWGTRRAQQIRQEDGTLSPPQLSGSLGELNQIPLRAFSWSLAGMMYGGSCWLAVVGMLTGDWLGPAMGFSAVAAAWTLLIERLKNNDTLPRRVESLWFADVAIGAISITVATLRWSTWQTSPAARFFATIPLWAFNVGVIALVAAMSLHLLRWHRRAVAAENDK